MKRILKASMICWGIVLAFFLFFLVPFGAIGPTAGAILSIIAGFGFLIWLVFYIRRLDKTEGFQFGWFIARKQGGWLIFLAGVSVVLLLAGILWFLAPESIEQPLINGAMPIAILFVLLFWFSIIFMFLGFAVVCFAESAAYLRKKDFGSSGAAFALAIFWLALGAGCRSLFLDVINDNFFRVSGGARNWSLLLVAIMTAAVGFGMGLFQELDKILPAEETGPQP